MLLTEDDIYMSRAISQAGEQLKRYGIDDGGERPNPFVGCVVVRQDGEWKAGYRGEFAHPDHAEYTVMEKKFDRNDLLSGATVYTTLEPCIERNPPKIACADRLIERDVRRVVIGMLDPDGRGQGARKLLEHGLTVAVYPLHHELSRQIREMNRVFIKSRNRSSANKVPVVAPERPDTVRVFRELR
jgi:ATP-dependent DNA helicase RecG